MNRLSRNSFFLSAKRSNGFAFPLATAIAILVFALPMIAVNPQTARATPIRQDQGSAAQEEAPVEQITDPAVNVQDGEQENDRQARVEKLERYLSGVKLIGNFTITGNEGALKEEEYTIKSAAKLDEGDYWQLTVRIKYGDHDVEMDLPPIEIKWADGTPVITVDQLTVPGLGTFDARVLIRKNKYAGTWSHNDVGGHLFGRVERLDAAGEEAAAGDNAAAGEAAAGAMAEDEPAEEPERITIQHILIGFRGSVPGKGITRSKDEAEELVAKIQERIEGGEDFDELVKELTDDSHPGIYKMVNYGLPGDRSSGDPKDWVSPRRGMVPGFGNVGFTLEVGDVGVAEFDTQNSPYGWHIIKRIE